VLEGPLSWILGTLYIFLTVCLGVTPICAIVSAAIGRSLPAPELDASVGPSAVLSADVPSWLWAARHLATIADSTLYAFLPWWTTVLIRLVQGRPWLHRVAGRSILIGDVPWVAQSAEAFASKLFALSYSIASCSFASANPADHLVHRHTHRVRRGSLLAVGRPDGRLNALTTAEAACTLAGGNPGLLEQMIRVYFDAGVLRRAGHATQETWLVDVERHAQSRGTRPRTQGKWRVLGRGARGGAEQRHYR
jgi:hypothetical protein